jgi:hypothetical protein
LCEFSGFSSQACFPNFKGVLHHAYKDNIPFDCRENLIFMGIFWPSEVENYLVVDHTRHGRDPGISPGNAKAYRQPGH